MGRSPCCEKAHTNKGAWTKEEDDRLIAYIRAHGEGCWRSLPKAAGLLRCGKSCRLRWINYLRPDLKRGNFTEEEDELIIKLHSLLGNKRKLLSRGIDPTTHRPINDPKSATSQEVTNISFSGAINSKEEEKNNISVIGGTNLLICKEENSPIRERCPDLNLELRISPPHYNNNNNNQHQILNQSGTGIRENSIVCFSCSLGIQNSKDCSCGNSVIISGSSKNSGYDFLGLKSGVLDYRSLEMK
ncbi:hypothetical protein DH2020_029647 [Rehmannia glutinosa]|uniref:R2R3-MYB protein n=1 Tax=Rehmannia glutinosa TaxID=99300 RepID=A0ABR0VNW0_REHGL